MTYQPHSMLVTGGAGFIGANFIHYILNDFPDIHIINLDKLTYAGNLDNLKNLTHPHRHHFIQGDINDSALINHIFNHYQIDTVVHFAAESHVDRSISNPFQFIHTNILGTHHLLECAKKYWCDNKTLSRAVRFHHISTDEVFGSLSLEAPPFTETSLYEPRSPYSASKASSDHLVRAYFHTYQLPITITHCSNNYGPYQHSEKFIPTIIRGCLKNEEIPIYGTGKNIRDWLYVTDHCQGIMAAICQGQVGESYCLGGHDEWENLKIAHLICDLFDEITPENRPHKQLLNHVTDRLGHDLRYAINAEKACSELSFKPSHSLLNGLRKTIEFYQKTM